MKKHTIISVIAAALFLNSCGSTGAGTTKIRSAGIHSFAQNNKLKLGMTKAQVEQKLGTPHKVSNNGNTWLYYEKSTSLAKQTTNATTYIVRSGSLGLLDFGTTSEYKKFTLTFKDERLVGWE